MPYEVPTEAFTSNPQRDEAALVARDVDWHASVHHATEPDEPQVLARLYGPPDSGGFHTGDAVGEGEVSA